MTRFLPPDLKLIKKIFVALSSDRVSRSFADVAPNLGVAAAYHCRSLRLRCAASQAHIDLTVKRASRELVEHCPYGNGVHALEFYPNKKRRLRLCLGALRLRLKRQVPIDFDLVLL